MICRYLQKVGRAGMPAVGWCLEATGGTGTTVSHIMQDALLQHAQCLHGRSIELPVSRRKTEIVVLGQVSVSSVQ